MRGNFSKLAKGIIISLIAATICSSSLTGCGDVSSVANEAYTQVGEEIAVLKFIGTAVTTFTKSLVSSAISSVVDKTYTYEDLTEEQLALLKTSGYDLEPGDELDKNQQYILKIAARAEKYLKDKYGREFTVNTIFGSGLMQSYTEFWLDPADDDWIYGMSVSVKATDTSDLSTYTDDYAAYYAWYAVDEKIDDCFDEICGDDAEVLLTTTDCSDWEAFDGSQTPEELIESGVIDFYSVVVLSDAAYNKDDMETIANEILDYLEGHSIVGGMHVYLVNDDAMDEFNRFNYSTSELTDKKVSMMNLSLNNEGIRRINIAYGSVK